MSALHIDELIAFCNVYSWIFLLYVIDDFYKFINWMPCVSIYCKFKSDLVCLNKLAQRMRSLLEVKK